MGPFATRLRVLVLAALLLVATLPPRVIAQDQSLYERLGELPAIEAVVDEFLFNVAMDDRINSFFAGADITGLRTLLIEQICAASGGPCTYSGRSMHDAHLSLGITQAHFNALVEDLVMALDALSVPDQEKLELLNALAPLAADIVEQPTAPQPPTPEATEVPRPTPTQLPPAPTAVPTSVPTPVPTLTRPPAPTATARPAPTRASVDIRNFAFNPATVTIPVGSNVTWTNSDTTAHTASGPNFDTGILMRGQSATIAFSTPGRISYQCAIHPNMRGEIVVQ